MNYLELDAIKLAKEIKLNNVRIEDVINHLYSEIETKDKEINCLITLCEKDEVLKRASEIQEKIDNGLEVGIFAGVPVVIKDNISTKNIATTCGSKILETYIPPYSAYVVEQLEKQDAIIIGKANMDEFAMGSTTETSYFGATKNPHNKDYVPGGSSGGSAAAVAANLCSFSLGTDTGGSIRKPCSYCGVVGIKPTYGTVSRYGMIAYGSSLDQIGPMAKNVTDCAHILEVISGYDEKDSTSIKRDEYDFTSGLVNNVKDIKIGVPKDYFGDGVDEEIKKAVYQAIDVLKKQGAVVEEFDLGLSKYLVPTYYIIASAEASSNLSRFDGVRYGYRSNQYKDLDDMYKETRKEGFGKEVKKRIMLGTFVLSSGYYEDYYLKASKVRRLIKEHFTQAFEKYDVIIGPVAAGKVPKIGESMKDPLKMYLSDIYTVSANLAGIPAMSIPCGKDSNGLPIGLQIMANSLCEKKLINVAYTYEQNTLNK